ncbi:hypothetical protein PV10_04088 [Exophiala mesophila]|uniref:Zn(2)-C6 fungal-type domain-containing protein n=1 Tax=Exophiala mesophila TaxID=212818 RepID=A0A0D1ZDN0_EXOME|nr:uncharacterized protein PV10_04088 [Exophiala mesophila]KIV92822.1 hypothetical protein PV10_04088 [Exophiala mesophila]
MPATSSDAVDSDELQPTDFEALVQLLSACKRCRKSRKRCDTQLPACANCSRAGTDCVFFDHVSKEMLPRRYVASMISHLKQLEARSLAKSDAGMESRAGSLSSFESHQVFPVRHSISDLGEDGPAAVHGEFTLRWRDDMAASVPCPPLSTACQALIDQDLHDFLISTFVDTLQGPYPILDSNSPFLQRPLSHCDKLSPWETCSLKMVYSIACHCIPANDTRLVLLSDVLYKEATGYVEEITADQNVESLQTIVLLALRGQFDGRNGSAGQQIAFAHRLETELTSREADEAVPALQRLKRIIYCISNQVSTALDRPSGLAAPENLTSTTDEADVLFHLAALQLHMRGDRPIDPAQLDFLTKSMAREWSPLVRTSLCETRFLLRPTQESAMQLLESYMGDGMILTIFVSRWTYNAVTFLLSNSGDTICQQGYQLGMRVLDRCALKWPNTRVLRRALQDRAYPSKQ